MRHLPWALALVIPLFACNGPGRLKTVPCEGACDAGAPAVDRDGGASDTRPAPPALTPGSDPCLARACGQVEPLCDEGQRCVNGLCRPDQGACIDDGDCSDDTTCRNRACVAFGETCTREPAFVEACTPALPLAPPHVTCNWTGGKGMSTPLVADLDHDGQPEVILALSSSLFGDPTSTDKDRVVALNARTCQVLWDVPAPVWSELAVADLDGDGRGEIVFASSPSYDAKETSRNVDQDETITVLDHQGRVRASFRGRRPALRWQAAPLIVDLDGVAPPEIVYRRTALRFHPAPAGGTLEQIWRAEPRDAADRWLSAPTAADLDGDGLPEILDGAQVLDGRTGQDETPPDLLPAKLFPDAAAYALPQVADFNQDGKPDALYVSPQGVSIYDFAARRILWDTRLPEEAPGKAPIGGPAVIADFDGDGVPDFGFATRVQFLAYALKCTQSPRPADCHGDPGVLWAKMIQDPSSGIAGATAFDFNADGVVEIVYRDETWLRIFSGPTGRTLFRFPISSGTALEEPVIADATGDGHADILVMSDDPPPEPFYIQPLEPETRAKPARTKGLFVLSDDGFAPARPLWNQHAYHVSNINDDLTVPSRPAPPWQGPQQRGVRQQALPSPTAKVGPAPDLTARLAAPLCGPRLRLRGSICNRGPVAFPGGAKGSFYDAPPDGTAPALCTTAATGPLSPGQCQEVSCESTQPGPGARPLEMLYLRVGDDGQGGRTRPQCSLGNDLASRRGVTCTSDVQ